MTAQKNACCGISRLTSVVQPSRADWIHGWQVVAQPNREVFVDEAFAVGAQPESIKPSKTSPVRKNVNQSNLAGQRCVVFKRELRDVATLGLVPIQQPVVD